MQQDIHHIERQKNTRQQQSMLPQKRGVSTTGDEKGERWIKWKARQSSASVAFRLSTCVSLLCVRTKLMNVGGLSTLVSFFLPFPSCFLSHPNSPQIWPTIQVSSIYFFSFLVAIDPFCFPPPEFFVWSMTWGRRVSHKPYPPRVCLLYIFISHH